ncbi:collagen alpha-1(I) chain-like [Mustela lutreola]|uniref:collagen alpha-1(I) chain-like n=1 Tax=Mustela lutreola TaxID=9666 RepID=UPI0027978B92|nr:collagen alpha-1(I) chain-like [Mustela lutreola]
MVRLCWPPGGTAGTRHPLLPDPPGRWSTDLLRQKSLRAGALRGRPTTLRGKRAVLKCSRKLRRSPGLARHDGYSLSKGRASFALLAEGARSSCPARRALGLGQHPNLCAPKPREQVPGGSRELKVPGEPIPRPGRSPREGAPAGLAPGPRRGRQTCATRVSRKRNDSFGRTESAAGAGRRAPGGLQGRPGRPAADRTRDRACFRGPCPRPESHAWPGTRPGALPGGGGAGAPGPRLRAAATLPARPPRPPPRRPGLPAGPASPPPPPPLTSARGRGGGHGSAGVGAARGRRPSALPLLTGSGLRRDAGGTNGLHYPRGPAIVRRHQAATVVLRAGGLPSLAPPSARFLPASARPPPRGPAPAARARPSPPRRRRRRRPRPRVCLRARAPPAA